MEEVWSPVDVLQQLASVYQENHRQLSSLSVKLLRPWQQRRLDARFKSCPHTGAVIG